MYDNNVRQHFSSPTDYIADHCADEHHAQSLKTRSIHKDTKMAVLAVSPMCSDTSSKELALTKVHHDLHKRAMWTDIVGARDLIMMTLISQTQSL